MGRPPRPASGPGLRGLRRHRLPPPPGRGLTCSSTATAPGPPRPRTCSRSSPPLRRRRTSLDRRTEALILAGELAQGLADAEIEASGADDATPLQAAALALATAEAGCPPRRGRPAAPAADPRRRARPARRAAAAGAHPLPDARGLRLLRPLPRRPSPPPRRGSPGSARRSSSASAASAPRLAAVGRRPARRPRR